MESFSWVPGLGKAGSGLVKLAYLAIDVVKREGIQGMNQPKLLQEAQAGTTYQVPRGRGCPEEETRQEAGTAWGPA